MIRRTGIFKAARCKHRHVNGRPCGVVRNTALDRKQEYCSLHLAGRTCEICSAMQRAFVPPKGW